MAPIAKPHFQPTNHQPCSGKIMLAEEQTSSAGQPPGRRMFRSVGGTIVNDGRFVPTGDTPSPSRHRGKGGCCVCGWACPVGAVDLRNQSNAPGELLAVQTGMLKISQFKRAKVKSEAIGSGALLAVLIAAIGLTGCHRNGSSGETAPPVQMSPASLNPWTLLLRRRLPWPRSLPPADYDNGVRENLAGEVNPSLTAQLHIFVQQKGRLPQSFNEFVNARLDSIPSRPPAGKRWASNT